MLRLLIWRKNRPPKELGVQVLPARQGQILDGRDRAVNESSLSNL